MLPSGGSYKKEVFPRDSEEYAAQKAMKDPRKAWPFLYQKLKKYCRGNSPFDHWPLYLQKFALDPYTGHKQKYVLTQFMLHNGYNPHMIEHFMIADKGWTAYQVNRLIERYKRGESDNGTYHNMWLNRTIPYAQDVSKPIPPMWFVPERKTPVRVNPLDKPMDWSWVKAADAAIQKEAEAEEKAKKAKVILEEMALLDLKCQCCGQPI